MNKVKYFSINLLVCYILIALLLLLTSAIFAYTSINDKYLDIFVYSSIGISIFLSSIFLNKKLKSKGIIYGSLFGLLIMLTIYIVGSIFFSFSITPAAITYIIISIIAGLVGGAIGVNI